MGVAHYLPQPALPQVPGCGSAGMAGRARGRAAAGAVLPCRVHAAGSDRRHRLPEQGRDLRSPVQGLGRDHDHHRSRSQAPRRPHRRSLRPPHLGLSAHPPSACPHDRAGRRHLAGRQRAGSPADRASSSRSRFSRACSAGCSWRSLSPRTAPEQLQFFGKHAALTRRKARSAPIWRRCATANGWSTASDPSADPSKCCAIWRATPTASPSPTAD